MPAISLRVPTGLARRSSSFRPLRSFSAIVTARAFRPTAPTGLAVLALAVTFTLSLAETSLGAAAKQTQAPNSTAVLGPGAGYGVGGGSRAVRQLQRRLRTHGYFAGRVDGVYGPRTATAVRRFQGANGLVADGVAGPLTVTAVASRRGGPVRPGAGYRSAGGDVRVRDVQRMLRATGYDPGAVDGRFGQQTQAAVQWFQAKHRLRASGVVDAASLRQLRRLTRGRPLPSRSTLRLAAPPPPWPGGMAARFATLALNGALNWRAGRERMDRSTRWVLAPAIGPKAARRRSGGSSACCTSSVTKVAPWTAASDRARWPQSSGCR